MAQRATSRPAAPPIRANKTLSVSSCLTIFPRPAPIASRTAISLRRATPRASSVLATFVQAISKTTPTTA